MAFPSVMLVCFGTSDGARLHGSGLFFRHPVDHEPGNGGSQNSSDEDLLDRHPPKVADERYGTIAAMLKVCFMPEMGPMGPIARQRIMTALAVLDCPSARAR
jgi:hypothetical protein